VSAESPTTPPPPVDAVPGPLADEIAAAVARGEAAAAAAATKPVPTEPADKAADKPKPVPPPTAAEIEADIAAARERLTGTLIQLEDAVTPASFARRGKTAVRNVYLDEFGGVKVKNVAITVGVVVGAIVVIKILK
jgi:hypothetical protein